MKKVISMVLALVMVLGMTTVAFATDFPDYTQTEISRSNANLIRIGYDNSGTCGAIKNYRMSDSIYVPNDTYDAERIFVTHNSGASGSPYIYIWAANNTTDKTYNKKVSESLADDWELTIEVVSKSGPVKNAFIESDGNGNAIIALEMEPFLNAVDSKSFSIECSLKSGSRKVRNTEFTIRGTYENRAQIVEDEDENEIDMTEGNEYKLSVKATVRDAMIEIDNGMFVSMRLTKGRDIYLRADTALTNDDIDMMEKYDLDNIIRLYSVNVKSTSTKVLFDDDDYYVYTLKSGTKTGKNAELKYIGETGDELEVLDIYILSRTKIDLSYDEPKDNSNSSDKDTNTNSNNDASSGIDFLPDIELPPLYDDDLNMNFNPSTGR